MTFFALLAAATVLLYLHRRAVREERVAWETRLDAQEYRHNAHFAKLLAAQASERDTAHATTLKLLEEMKAARDQAADERVQLMNRVKPDTFQPPLTQATELFVAPPAVSLDDDEAFWKARESRDEMVERIEREMQAVRT